MSGPSYGAVIKSIKKWGKRAGVKVTIDGGAKTRCRPWSNGLRGVVIHHWAGVGDGGLEWMAARQETYPFCNAAVRRTGEIVVLAAGSAWGSGTGGPWAAAGIPKDSAHLYCFQIENESWGEVKDFTDPMFAANAAVLCALREVAGPADFPDFSRAVNHCDWTNGSGGVADYKLPTYGRKNDTLYSPNKFRKPAQELWDKYQSGNQTGIKARLKSLFS